MSWREIDQRMRKLARRRAALDAEEAELLLAAKRAEVHKHLGYGTFAEYLGRVCGYAPGTARDRMRVAEALEGLPAMREALAAGMVTYSTVRELTRFVDGETEEDWIVAVEGCTAREVEELARGRAVGDLPEDRPHADLEPRRLRLDLLPPDYALFLEARRHVEQLTGEQLTDADFMRVACRAVLGGSAGRDAGSGADDPAGVGACNEPPHQIAVTVCADCKRGWHETGGQSLELTPAHVERMRCDAVELGRVDGEVVAERVRTIPAGIRRAVLARDRQRCTVPGCTSSLFVDLHHLHPWSQGGEHSMSNLTTLCTLHHDLAHHGGIVISGSPGALVVLHADGRPYGMPPAAPPHVSGASTASGSPPTTPHVGRASAASDSAATAVRAQALEPGAPSAGLVEEARMALTGLGFRRAEATAAVAEATLQVTATVTLEQLVRAALVACRRHMRT